MMKGRRFSVGGKIALLTGCFVVVAMGAAQADTFPAPPPWTDIPVPPITGSVPTVPGTTDGNHYYLSTSDPFADGTVDSDGIRQTIDDAKNSAAYEQDSERLQLSKNNGTLIYGIEDSSGPYQGTFDPDGIGPLQPPRYRAATAGETGGVQLYIADTTNILYVPQEGDIAQTSLGAGELDNSKQGRMSRNSTVLQAAVTSYVNSGTGGGGGLCAQQLDPLSLSLEAAGTGTDLAGAIIEAVTSPEAEFGAEVASNLTQAAGLAFNLGSVVVDGIAASLPNCDAQFTGTVETDANVYAGQGVQAFDGAMSLGNPDGQSYQQGISLGGGALAGMGTGDLALADDATSIAIGNGAHAGDGTDTPSYALALGDHADASAKYATAIGANAAASGVSSIAIGQDAEAQSEDSVAIGHGAVANGSTAVGAFSEANGTDTAAFGKHASAKSTGGGATALGEYSEAIGDKVTAVGDHALAYGASVSALGSSAVAAGTGNMALGADSIAYNPATFAAQHFDGTNMTAIGQGAQAIANNALAVGQGSEATEFNATALGQGSLASGQYSTATGQAAQATAVYATAYGNGAIASAAHTTAVGPNANASYIYSAAYGDDAVATAKYQQMFGTTNNTYNMPGVTSHLSTIRQTGPKSLVTTDAHGAMAADQGMYDQIGENQQGIAMALALGNFWVPQNKKFAVGFNTAAFDGMWAVGANVGGELHDGLSVTGGVAVSASGMVSGRVGSVMSW